MFLLLARAVAQNVAHPVDARQNGLQRVVGSAKFSLQLGHLTSAGSHVFIASEIAQDGQLS